MYGTNGYFLKILTWGIIRLSQFIDQDPWVSQGDLSVHTGNEFRAELPGTDPQKANFVLWSHVGKTWEESKMSLVFHSFLQVSKAHLTYYTTFRKPPCMCTYTHTHTTCASTHACRHAQAGRQEKQADIQRRVWSCIGRFRPLSPVGMVLQQPQQRQKQQDQPRFQTALQGCQIVWKRSLCFLSYSFPHVYLLKTYQK